VERVELMVLYEVQFADILTDTWSSCCIGVLIFVLIILLVLVLII